jgi:hypothetical protein
MTDRRIKAVGAVSAINLGAMYRAGRVTIDGGWAIPTRLGADSSTSGVGREFGRYGIRRLWNYGPSSSDRHRGA